VGVASRQALRLPSDRSRRARLAEGAGLGLLALTAAAACAGASGLVWGLWAPALDMVYGLGVVALLVGMACVAAIRAVQGVVLWIRDRPRLSRIIQNQQLEIKTAALALRQQERRSAVLEERQRLSRDMHDGIGGQLSSLLARVRSRGISPEQIESELTSGLAELRLMVDSLDASYGPVADALSVLRSRVRTQTEAAGMALDWTQSEKLEGIVADPSWILNFNRMIQEAVTNAVRHSAGRCLGVAIVLTDDDRLEVIVRDDGVGFDRNEVRPGRGLANLAFRAAQMNGSIRFARGEGGRGTIIEAFVAVARGQSDAEMMPC
jgi:signal transduction histidine kinase